MRHLQYSPDSAIFLPRNLFPLLVSSCPVSLPSSNVKDGGRNLQRTTLMLLVQRPRSGIVGARGGCGWGDCRRVWDRVRGRPFWAEDVVGWLLGFESNLDWWGMLWVGGRVLTVKKKKSKGGRSGNVAVAGLGQCYGRAVG
jgi:hypothetical protein